MKFTLLSIITTFILFTSSSYAQVKLKTFVDSLSYSFGANFSTQLKNDGIDFNMDTFTQAMKDVLYGDGSKLTQEQMTQIMNKFQKDFSAQQQEKMMKDAANNKLQGQKFLEENKKKPNIKTTASGLQYKVIKEANGPKPADTSTVKVHYEGKLLDGTIFDSSVKRGEPIEFPLNRVIPGWTEGVQLMSVGSKYKFYIPSDLAYGDQGAPPTIPPGATLIFEVELLDIVK